MGAVIWLASYPKSGNTWMRAFLYNLLRNPPAPADINTLDRFCLGESHAPWYQRHLDKPLARASNAEIARIRARAQADFTRAFPDSVFVKTHNYLGHWHGAPLHNMDITAAAIYVVRNPLDVAVSMTHHFDLDSDGAIARLGDEGAGTGATAEHIPERHASWSTHVSSWTARPSCQLHLVRYEDLLARPRVHFGRVARFLGLAPPRERLERAISHSTFATLRAQERAGGFKERAAQAEAFFRAGRTGQWRTALSAEQIARVVARHRQQMAHLGYLPGPA